MFTELNVFLFANVCRSLGRSKITAESIIIWSQRACNANSLKNILPLSLELNQNMLKLSSRSTSVAEMHHNSKSMWSQKTFTSPTNILASFAGSFCFQRSFIGTKFPAAPCLAPESEAGGHPQQLAKQRAAKCRPTFFHSKFSKIGSLFCSRAISDLTLSSVKQNNLFPPTTSSSPNILSFPYYAWIFLIFLAIDN